MVVSTRPHPQPDAVPSVGVCMVSTVALTLLRFLGFHEFLRLLGFHEYLTFRGFLGLHEYLAFRAFLEVREYLGLL